MRRVPGLCRLTVIYLRTTICFVPISGALLSLVLSSLETKGDHGDFASLSTAEANAEMSCSDRLR